MGKFTAIIIKNLIKTTLNMYGIEIIIAMFIAVELITCTIVFWETITGKNIIDVMRDYIFKDESKPTERSQSSKTSSEK